MSLRRYTESMKLKNTLQKCEDKYTQTTNASRLWPRIKSGRRRPNAARQTAHIQFILFLCHCLPYGALVIYVIDKT